MDRGSLHPSMAGLRFYVHVQVDGAGPDHTFIASRAPPWRNDDSIDALRQHYAREYDEIYGSKLRYKKTTLCDANGVAYASAKLVPHVIRRGADVFICEGTCAPPPRAAATVGVSASQQSAPVIEEFVTPGAQQVAAEEVKAQASAATKAAKPQLSSQLREVEALLEQSKSAMAGRSYKQARRLHNEVFALDKWNATARREEAEICLVLKDFDGAEAHVNTALAARPRPQGGAAAGLYVVLGDALQGQLEHDDAVDAYNSALSAGRRKHTQEWEHDIKIKLARSHLALHPREATDANNLIKEVLGANPNHRQALLFYGEVMLERQNVQEALGIYLRLVAASMGEDKAIKRPLARLLALPGAVQALESTLPPTPGAQGVGDIYGYLANQAKDRGVLKIATQLYRTAIEIEPSRSNYCLNHVHTLELSFKLDTALADIKSWLSEGAKKNLGVKPDATAAALYGVLAEAGDAALSIREPDTGGGIAFADAHDISAEHEGDLGNDADAVPIDKEGLDFLALGFTLCKVAFVAGQLEILPQLIRLLSEDHRSRELHKTTIKNEAAYFGCVKQLTALFEFPQPPLPSHSVPIYVIGDSHCLATGWRTLQVGGQVRMMRPMLVTGLKCWHMRDEEDFYPKANFDSVVSKIPKGAEVIFLFGEIDCREGIFVAVERLKYRDLEHGIDVAQDIYLKKMKELQRTQRFSRIYVHPVPPVMDITRNVVAAWNNRLAPKVEALHATTNLRWLDFWRELLSEDGTKLQPQFGLDGIHLHPCYIEHLQRAINVHQ